MRDATILLACLASLSHARRAQTQDARFQRGQFQDEEHMVDSLHALTRVLFVSPQTLTVNPSTRSRHIPLGSPPASPTRPWSLNNYLSESNHRSRSQPGMSVGASQIAELAPPKTNAVTRAVSSVAFVISTIIALLGVYPPLLGILFWSWAFDNKRRRGCDWIVQLWAKLTLLFIGSKIIVEGVENLPPSDEAVLYAPNHCSFLDIFSLSGFLPRRFKYVSKIEILRIPLIGWAMKFAKHIAIRRSDRRSQLQTLKDAISCLEDGSSLVTFPEGTRSKDGRLAAFKKGPFTMAARSGRRVVPITIVGTQLFQPPGAFLPYAIPRGVKIICHPPVTVEKTKAGEAKALDETRTAIMSALPPSMLPA